MYQGNGYNDTTSNDIIVRNGRERFMIEFIFFKKYFQGTP